MKTQRVVIVVLSLLVVVLAYLAFSNRRKAEEPQANTGGMQTNTIDLWHTNVLEKWRTNTVEVPVTNTVTQTVTNEVIKEVPAKLSSTDRQAALIGFKYLHAPMLENAPDTLYKAGPFAVDLYLDATAATLLGCSTEELRKTVEDALRAQNVPVAEKSSQHLRLNVSPLWRMSDPRVALVSCKLELKETAAVERKGDILKCDPVVWSTSSASFVRTINMGEGVSKCVQDSVDKFCKAYAQAKDSEKQIEPRIPKPAADFLSSEK